MSMDSYQAFIIQRAAEIRRIARQTCGEHTAEDVQVEAWLIAERISTKRGFSINFSHRADQEQVLAWLYNHLVKYADKQIRYAVKLDKDWDKEDADAAVHAMARLLTAPDSFDPAVMLLRQEDEPDPLGLSKHSYSQASAYVILLSRFDWDAEELAVHLCIVVHTLRARLRWFGAWTRWQGSLFDGVQTIPLDFEPTKARKLERSASKPEESVPQLSWNFSVKSSKVADLACRANAGVRSQLTE
nr:hypothetical protein [uncultured Roseateles sp.]